MSTATQDKLAALLQLSRELGDKNLRMAILGEGNTSTRLGGETFIVKASGTSLGTLREQDVVECRFDALLPVLERDSMTDEEVETSLLASRVDPQNKKPSVEAVFHAYCLTLPGIDYVGHAHCIAVNQILCSPRAAEFAAHRMFPDEIVCCGVESVFVPYTDPGFELAKVIRQRTEAFMQRQQTPPRVILLENHGVIALGRTAQAVLSAMLMVEKAAQIWMGAALLGGPKYFTPFDVRRIANRSDEHYRQRMLNL